MCVGGGGGGKGGMCGGEYGVEGCGCGCEGIGIRMKIMIKIIFSSCLFISQS